MAAKHPKVALMRSEAIAAVVAAADHFCITAEKLSNIFSSICVVMIFDGTTDLLEVFSTMPRNF